MTQPRTRSAKSKPLGSPCVDVCRLDARSGECLGCRRTMREISAWTQMSEGERAKVLEDLPRRWAARA